MAIINKGTAFSNGEQLSASKLNDLLDAATFGTDSIDNSSTILSNGSITVRDSGITAAKLATNAVETAKIKDANVTKAKIENVADYKVLGNVSGTAAAPAEVAILDEDDMVSNSDTALATQKSIKAYVDSSTPTFVPSTYIGGESVTLPNGLIMKFGTITAPSDATATVTFGNAFPNSCLVVNATFNDNRGTSGDEVHVSAHNIGASSFQLTNATTSALVGWQAIGY